MQCLQGRAPAATSTSRASSSGSTALPTSSTARPPSARRRVWHCRQLTSPVLCTAGAYREGTSQPSAPAGRPPAGVTEEQVALFRAVKDHQRAGRRSEALALLQDSLALYPTDRNLLALTVSLLLKSNQLTEARTVLLTAQQHHPTHFAFVAAHARLEVRLGHPDAAVSRLEDAMRRYPNNAVLHETLAEVLAGAGDVDSAREHHWHAIQLAPDKPHAYAALAQLEASQGQYQRARQLYKRGTECTKDAAPVFHAWAKLECELGNHSMAKTLCERALKVNPHHVPSHMLLGQLQWMRGSLAAARETWQRANSTPAGASVGLLCFWAQREARVHNYRAARQLLQDAQRLCPQDLRAATLLAALEDRARDSDAATQAYRALVPSHSTAESAGQPQPPASSPATADTTATPVAASVETTATVYTPSLDRQDAVASSPQAAVQGVGTGPQATSAGQTGIPVPVLLSFCQHLLRLQDTQAAEEILRQVEAREPCNGHMCHIRGLLAQQEGLVQIAEEWFRRGGRSPPKDGGLLCWEGLAELLAFQGRQGDARAAWRGGVTHAQRHWHPVHTQYPTHNDNGNIESRDESDESGVYVGVTSRFLRQWALFEKKSGWVDEAARLFAASTVKDPQDYKTWLAWAVLERRRGQLQVAEQLFRRGIAVAPRNPHLWYAYASMLWRQRHDVKSAREVLRKATSLCPRNVALLLEWALLEWKGAGDPVAARQLLKRGAAVPLPQPYGPLYEAWAQLDREMMNRRGAGRPKQESDEVSDSTQDQADSVDAGTVNGAEAAAQGDDEWGTMQEIERASIDSGERSMAEQRSTVGVVGDGSGLMACIAGQTRVPMHTAGVLAV